MKKLLSFLFLAVLIIGLNGCTEKKDDSDKGNRPDKLVMGFVPSSNSDTIADTIEPLAQYLTEKLGITVEGKVMTNYNALVEAMGSNQVQIGFVPPLAYVEAHEKYGIEVIFKAERYGSGSYLAQYVVRADSGIDSLEDLRGKVWAYGDTTSTSGYLYPAAQIMDTFNDVTDPATDFFSDAVETGGHDASVIAVLEGTADVATTFDDARSTVLDDYPNVMTDTKILGYTNPIPNDTISVVKDLDADLLHDIKVAFYSINQNEDMLKILNDVYEWDAIVLADDFEYDPVRSVFEKFESGE